MCELPEGLKVNSLVHHFILNIVPVYIFFVTSIYLPEINMLPDICCDLYSNYKLCDFMKSQRVIVLVFGLQSSPVYSSVIPFRTYPEYRYKI